MPIVARHHDIRDRVLAAVDKAFAEPVLLSFLKNGAPDPDREPVEVEGVLRAGGGKETNLSGGFAQDWRSRLSAGKAELHINTANYPSLDVSISRSISVRVQATSRKGEPWWEVLRVDDRGESRLVLELGEI